MRPPVEVADIVRLAGDRVRQSRAFSREQERALSDIVRCRTAALGGHKDVCRECGFERPAYNSCRNRHCPKCQALEAARWLERRRARILPVHYFHVVFTLPAELRPLARANRGLVFDAMFAAAGEALCQLGRDPRRIGAELGVTTVLHTWTRELEFHPHIHCVVTGGGLALGGDRWIATRPDFLLPVRVLGAMFRGKVLAALASARAHGKLSAVPEPAKWRQLMRKLYRLRWHTYVKPPFGGPEQVFAYLGRYTHRVAISNYRLLSLDERGVRFRTRGDGEARLSPEEFLARFVEHVLPPGFVKIRHYGLHSASHATTRLEQARALLCAASPAAPAAAPTTDTAALDWRDLTRQLTEVDLARCPRCGQGSMERVALLTPGCAGARAPPERKCA